MQSIIGLSDRTSPRVLVMAILFALIPLAGAILWEIVGDVGDVRNKVPVDLTSFFALGLVVVGLAAGLTKRISLRGSGITTVVPLAVFAAVLVAGIALRAAEPAAALERLAMRAPFIAVALSVWFLVSAGTRADHRAMLWAIAAQPLVHLPYLAWLYVTGVDDPDINWLGGPIGFWHVRIWGMVLACAILAAIGLHMTAPDRATARTIATGAFLTILWTLLFWSGSRGPALAVVASLGFAAIFFPRRTLPVLPLAGLTAAAGAGLSLLLTVPLYAYGLMNAVAETSGASNPESLSGGRMRMWTDVIDHIRERPLLGHGFDQFRYSYDGYLGEMVQPHNALLELLFDFGVIGAAAAAWLLLLFWARGLASVRRAEVPEQLGGLLVLNALVVMAMFDGILYHSEPAILVAFAYAILLARPGGVASHPKRGYIASTS